MRVLHVITTLAPGVAEHQLRLLLRRSPYDCEVVTLSETGPLAAAIRADGIPVHELAGAGNSDLAAIGQLRKLIRLGHFDLVHTHRYRGCAQGRPAARLAGVQAVVATEHGDGITRGGALYLAGERLGRMTIAPSPAIADRLRARGVPEARLTVIPPALDISEFRYDPELRSAARARLGIAPDVPVIGGVGQLVPGKRFDRLIRAVGEAPGATLLLVGDGPARAALESLAMIEGVADRVVFAGAVGHVREMLCAMDVFASPSEQDALGLVVLEALAAGLPALYAACLPLEELAAARRAVDGSQRLTPHDPESLPRALRAELLCLAERRGGRLPVRSAGSRYDAAHMAAAVGRLYQRVAGRRSRGAEPAHRGARRVRCPMPVERVRRRPEVSAPRPRTAPRTL
jgi:glycosyltransferase involved in cell wall biosynthesis